MAFHSSISGLDGFAIRLGRRIAEGLNLDAEFVSTQRLSRVDDLLAGEFDLLMTAPPATMPLAREALLTNPIGRASLVAVADASLPMDGLTQLRGHHVAALDGRFLAIVDSNLPPGERQTMAFRNLEEIATALAEGHCDVAVVPDYMAPLLIVRLPWMSLRLRIADYFLTCLLRFGEHDLLRAVNSQLFILRQEQELATLHEVFFGRPLPPLGFL